MEKLNRHARTLTGYPSKDKPWLKHYSDEIINAPLPQCTLYEYLWLNNKDHLHSYALNYFGKKVTFGEMFRRIDETAAAFAASGIKKGETIIFVTLSCVNSVLCFYALNKLGAAVSFISVLASVDEMAFHIRDTGSKLVVAMDIFADRALEAVQKAGAEKLIVYAFHDDTPLATTLALRYKLRKVTRSYLRSPLATLYRDFLRTGRGVQPTFEKDPKEMCFLVETSGTTGFPKRVRLNDLAFNAIVQYDIMTFPHQRGEVFLKAMIPWAAYGTLVNMHMPLCLGLELAIVPKFNPADWKKYIEKYHVAHCVTIPSHVVPMLYDPKLTGCDLSGLKTVGLGGEGMNAQLEEKLNTFFEQHGSSARVMMGYGMTEVCATAATSFAEVRKIGSVGIPLPFNIITAYNNEKGEECRHGEEGELCMRCATEMMGYKDNEEEMRRLYQVHADGHRWMHTGDIGYVDEDGFVFVNGRIKRIIVTMINSISNKVSPSMVERVLNTDENVCESCAVRGRQGNNYVVHACVIPQGEVDCRTLEAKLRALCASKLADDMQPAMYTFMDSFPRTSAGKVDYRALENL
jgi:long-chain acyl-CoA synthetase